MKQIVVILIVLSIFTGSSHAGWIDDWASQSTSSGPASFEGQKRQYYSGGSFSARYYPSKDYLVSVNAPSIKMGCGGIDILMGGFSYLKPDQMVDKMKKIITSPAAAAFAFDMALGILCEPCKNSLNEMEKFVNSLNNINLDDCKAAKTVATIATSPLTKNPSDTVSKAIDTAITDTGLKTAYNEARDAYTNIGNFSEDYKKWREKEQGISPEANRLLLTKGNDSLAKGSLIAKAFAEIATKNSEDFAVKYKPRVELIRGFIGDFTREDDMQNGFPVGDLWVRDPACAKNIQGYEAFLNGEIQSKSIDTNTCYSPSDVNKDLKQKTLETVIGIITKMKSKGGATADMTAEETQFIEGAGTPVYRILKQSVALGVSDVDKGVLAEYIAEIKAYYMFRSLLDDSYMALDTYNSAVSKQGVDAVNKQGSLELIMDAKKTLRLLAEQNTDMIAKKTQQFQTTMFSTLQRLREVDKMISNVYGTKIRGR